MPPGGSFFGWVLNSFRSRRAHTPLEPIQSDSKKIKQSYFNLNFVADDLDLVRRNSFLGRWMPMLPRLQMEPARMPRTFDFQALDIPLMQRRVPVRANLVDGEATIPHPEQGEFLTANVDADADSVV
jgi:hypothetical protein